MIDLCGNIEKFRNFIERRHDGYRFAVFSYAAIKQGEAVPVIMACAVRLLPILDSSALTLFTHDSPSLVAGILYWEIEDDPLRFLSRITEGIIVLPNGDALQVGKNEQTDLWYQFNQGTALTKGNQPRSTSLRIVGGGLNSLFDSAGGLDEIDCELQSSCIPFDGLSDLFRSLSLNWNLDRMLPEHKSEIMIHADPLIVLDRPKSLISSGIASIYCRMASGLNKDRVRIGIRPWDGNYSGRKSIRGGALKWTEENGIATGLIENEVGDIHAALVFLTYDNTLFDRWWIFNPQKHINPAYAVHLAIDNEFKELRRFLSGQSNDPGRDLELGVALLLSLLRFSVAHYGKIPTLKDGPDILAFAEVNQLAVIECTTGLPDANKKISKLFARAEQIRASLQNSGNSHLEVMPVIVTTISRDMIQRDITDAANHGVLVLGKENIEALLERVRIPPSPSQLFAEAKGLIEASRSLSPTVG